MRKAYKTVSKILVSGLLILELLLVGSCDTWMSNDDFMEQIEAEVHDANAAPINVYVRYANAKMGTTEPQGSTTMKVDVASKISAVTNDDYGFVRWAAFSQTDFPTDKQHSKLTFISEDDYNANYKDKELPDSVVHFSDPTNPATEVKILAERSDVFIIPIVANRPAYVQSVPANADNNVVKNTSIRILFSKPIDRKTIYDEEGNLNISISTSAAVFTDDDKEMESNDITDLFDITENSFSESGKMLTLKLKADSLLDNRQYITVTLLEGLKDLYGFSMNGNYTFKFQTGTSTDSLAPMIEVIYGGTDDICNVFVTFGEDGEMKGTATTESMNAPSDINSEKYTDAVIAQRVYDKLNIFVKANDIINSGNADINPAKDLSEDNVALVYIEAGLYIDSNGTPITIDDTNSTTYKIGKRSYTYISGAIDSGASIQKQFTDVVPVDKDGNKYNGGTIYTYDVSNLPDGLIRIDVWAGDMTGNAGDPDNNRAWAYYEKHDNGYKSLFIVKDTTPIDSAEVKAKKQVVSNSAAAPYYWYNLNTLNTMELFDSPDNMIHDKGHPKLRALDKNLWWTFKVGNQTTRVEKNDQSWKRIHDEETGTQALHYRLTDANAPSVDGPVDITLYLKDDMGNLSDPVLLDSIMYDNTQPRVSLKSGKGDFVNQAGEEQLHASDPKVIEQILKVTIGESNENNNGSGIRRIDIHIKKGNDEVDAPLDAEHLKVLYAPSSIENPTPSSEGIRQIAIQTAEADGATTNNTKIFNVTDADKITDGTLFIYGLSLGDTDGTYEVSVDLFDSALNKTEAPAVTRIARDTTAPVINKVQVIGAQARKVYGHDEETWWLPLNYYDESGLSKVAFNLDVTETGSGLKIIKLADNIEYTSSSKIKYGETYLQENVDYILNTQNHTIELLDWFSPKLKDETANMITLENVRLNNLNKAEGNAISITVDDFVDKHSASKTDFYYNDTAAGTVIYGDTVKPGITNIKIQDSSKRLDYNPYSLGYNSTYTDSQNVTLILNLDAESAHNGSGVKTIHLSDNATFTSTTEIFVDDEKLINSTDNYTISADNLSVEFVKVFTEANKITFTNVHMNSDVQGAQTINAYLTDFVGLENESKTSEAVIYDNVEPVIGNIEWVAPDGVAKGSANSNEITNQTFKVDFTEETSGTRVIKFDVTYENETESYDNPFELPGFNLSYGDRPLVRNVDYTIHDEDKRYILLNENNISKSGTFNFSNIKLRNNSVEGQYNIKVTLIDQAENRNWNENTNPASFNKSIFIDTTYPIVSKVIVKDVQQRQVYKNPSDTRKWWIPYSKFDGEGNLSKVDLEIKVNEIGSGIKIIKLSEDVDFTASTELWNADGKLAEGVDYTLDVAAHTITLLNYEQPKLRGELSVFTIKNVKLSKFNLNDGNKLGFAVEDFVTNPGSNQNVIYYNENNYGEYVYADSEKPEINTLNIEDSLHNNDTNPDNIAWTKENYTDSQNITLILSLKAEDVKFGSGVKVIHLTENGQFTDSTSISVGNEPLTRYTDYDFASDKKSVEFTKVFTADNVITFTNVHIEDEVDGKQTIKAKLTDFVGIEADVKISNELILDKVNPSLAYVDWVPKDDTITTSGNTNTNIITDQRLQIDFTEQTAGVKIIKLDIAKNGETDSYNTPFAYDDLKLSYEGYESEVPLAIGTDYTVQGKYIILNNTYTSGTFFIEGIKLKDSNDEGSYNVKLTLLDAAERKVEENQLMAIDTVAPQITEDLKIPNLKCAVELKTTGETQNDYWVDIAQINKSTVDTTSQKPNAIPVYIKLREKSSGVKVIEFSEDVILNSNTTTLWLKEGNTETQVDSSKYTVGTHTITINNKIDSRESFAKDDNSEFELIVKNIAFNKADSDEANTVKVVISDVAKNKDSNGRTTTQATIHSDSCQPTITENSLKLEDRATSAETVIAASGYTNDSIVNMTFDLTESERYGSGYHKFVITGATFKKVAAQNTANTTSNALNATNVTMTSGSNSIQNLAWDISDDGRTLTLKKYGQDPNEDSYAVVRQAVKVTIENVHLDDNSDGEHTVTLTAYDLTGWNSPVASTSIILDTHCPEVAKDVNDNLILFAADYQNSATEYYVPSVNVYPHANGETAKGVLINYNGKSVPTFYTATTYETGKYQYNGQVSASSTSSNQNFTYGAVIGIRAKDNKCLLGYARTSQTFLYYVEDSSFEKGKSDILAASNANVPYSSEKSKKHNDTTANNSSTNEALWFGIAEGKYSAVIVDEAGNCSDVFHFAVAKDNEKPAKTWGSGNNADSLNKRVLLQMPDASANVFTNSSVTVANPSDFPSFHSYRMGDYSIRTKKYVTKQTENNYIIQLNLGGTYSSDTPIKGISEGQTVDAATTTKYTELDAQQTSSPIEMYAVSTYYGSWPTSDTSNYKYAPVVPKGTTFPSGQQHTTNSYSETNSNLGWVLGHNYFGYESARPESNAWRIPDNIDVTWHSYKTGDWNTDSGNGIVSKIDANNNLLIKIPNDKSTAPVSVFLRDGCGNMEYVVCGLYEISDNKQVAVSFVLDDKLGSASTTNGVVTTPFLLQFPYSSFDSTGGDFAWDTYEESGETKNYMFRIGTQSGNSEAPSSQYGTGQELGFMKDEVKHATYYNPALSNSTKEKQYKHAFALHFFPNNVDRENPANITGKESITFDDSEWTDSEKTKGMRKASATDIAQGNYTCRALIYCTDNTTVPSYADIKACLEAEKNRSASEKTGQVTDWSYVQVSSNAIEAIILVDYPQPKYDKLNWTVNDASTHETKPFYMWYIFEDAVGNYELAKVVNSAVMEDALKAAPSATSSYYDKWLYDATGPVLNIRGTTVQVNELGTAKATNQIGSLDEQVKKLVAANNGYVPYLNSSTIWVSSAYNTTGRDESLLNTNTGWGTTHAVEKKDAVVTDASILQNRKYMPFIDIDVDEITGIRAFCWSNSSTAPLKTSDFVTYVDNTQGDYADSDKWYAGYNSTSLTRNIGSDYDYLNTTNAYMKAVSAYDGKYSGTKVNTLIPPSRLSTTEAKPLYLHVMDWTGNIASYRIGNGTTVTSGLMFKNDTDAPVTSTTTGTSTETGKYYVKYDNSKITIRIAGSTIKEEDVKVRFSSSGTQLFYADKSSGSGYAGFSFNPYYIDVNSNTIVANSDTKGPYLVIPKEKYLSWKANGSNPSGTEQIYFFDKVGNTTGPVDIKCIYDEDPPKITGVTLSASGGKLADSNGATETGTSSSPVSKSYTYTANADCSATAKKPGETGFVCKDTYINLAANGKISLQIDHDATDDFDHMEIYKWNGTSWPTTATYTLSSATDTTTSHYKFADNSPSGTDAYYKIIACDYSGNMGCQYIHLILDRAAPTISETPIIELGKGSINKITTGTGNNQVTTYYYTAGTAEAEMLKINLSADDAGIGVAKNAYEYSLNGTDWYSLGDTPSAAVIGVSSGDIEKIYLRDCLGNSKDYSPTFNYSYTNASGEADTENIRKLTYYTSSVQTTPSIKWNNVGASVNTKKGNGNWENIYVTKLTSSGKNYVLIKDKTQTQLSIVFEPKYSNGNNNPYIIGYIAVDGDAEPVTTSGAYSLRRLGQWTGNGNNKKVRVSEDISNINKDNTFKRKYYAVDVVGNLSEPLELEYTFDNPHKAKDITWIKTIDDIGQADVKTAIQNDIDAGTFKLATFYETSTGDKGYKPGNIYFSDGYLLVRCTLYEKADNNSKYSYDEDNELQTDEYGNPVLNPNHYLDTPEKIEMLDVYYDTYGSRNRINNEVSRGSATGDSRVFKVYPSASQDSAGRYYCYIAFKPGTYDDNGKYQSTFNNNDDYDGSDIYVRISGGSSTSDVYGDEGIATYSAVNVNVGRLNTSTEEAGNAKGWKQDITYPSVTGNYYQHEVITNYTFAGTKALAYDQDNADGAKYKTVAYSSGSKILIPTANITDTITGMDSYRFDYSGNTSTSWTTMTPNGDNYEFAIPDITTTHSNLTLYIKDKAGNTVSYTVADTGNANENRWRNKWWIKNDILNANSTIDVDAPTDGWTPGAASYTFKVTPPAGSIITSISATAVSDTSDSTPCTINSVEFSEYKGTQPAVSELNQGFLNLGYINVTINKIEPIWEKTQTVKITLNGTINIEVPETAFKVDKRVFSADDITISDARQENDSFVVDLTSNTGAVLANYITGVSAKVGETDIDLALSDDKTKVTLSNIPRKLWSTQNVTLTVNASNGVSKSKVVLEIGAIENGDITIGTATWNSTASRYEVTVEYKNNASPSAITTVTSTKGTVAFANKEDGSDDTTKIWLTPPAKTWDAQTIGVTVKDGDTHSVSNDNVLTIEGLKGSDFTVTPGSNGVYTISMNDGSSLPEIAVTDLSIEGEANLASISAWESPDVTLTFNPDWTDKTVTLKLKELEIATITVSKKVLTASMFKIYGTDSKPLSWSPDATTTYAAIIVTPPDGVTLTDTVSVSSDSPDLPTITYNSNNQYGIQAQSNKSLPSDLIVTITVNVGGENKEITFALNNLDGEGHPKTPGAANDGSRSIFGVRIKGNTYSLSSTSAGATGEAPKTRSVSLSSWVNDTFGNDSEVVKDEVKTSAKKAAKKAAKKTSKKSAKAAKVEKVAAESIAETTAAPMNEVVETVAATVSAVTEVVEEAAPAVQEVTATVEPEAAAPLSADPAVPETSVETPSASTAAIVLAIAALCAAAAALTIIALKKRTAKK